MRVVKVHDSVIKRLRKSKILCSGELYGLVQKDTFIVMGVLVSTTDDTKPDKVHLTTSSFPMEIEICGRFDINTKASDEAHLGKYLDEIDVTDNPIYIHIEPEKGQITPYFYSNNRLEEASIEVLNNTQLNSQFLHTRLKAQLTLVCEFNIAAIKEAFLELRKELASGAYVFHCTTENIFLPSSGAVVTGGAGTNSDGSAMTVEEVLGISDIGERKKKNKLGDHELEVVYVDMLKRVSREMSGGYDVTHAPVMQLERKSIDQLNMIINLDALSLINRKTKLNKLYSALVESSLRNVKLYQRATIKQFRDVEGSEEEFSTFYPRIYHFYPESCGHFVTRVYNVTGTEYLEEPGRHKLHTKLILPTDVPIFKRTNVYKFKDERNENDPLLNPHESVKPTNNGGTIACVRGFYHYYHYNQQREDDDGWGCAYRSLQTLASWYQLQGYTDLAPPSLRDIQRCLCDLGDKPASFVGSRLWIGSTEVSYVLNSRLAVDCKILYVGSGGELGDKGGDLLEHFQQCGSPVMIGGGTLAHTILGVDYNANTGGLKFLILDPHYTGQEDLHTIITKNWCAWKGVEFWDKKSYYNMCLPQVKRCV